MPNSRERRTDAFVRPPSKKTPARGEQTSAGVPPVAEAVNPNTKLSNVMKAAELAGLNGLHFRRNSQNGQYVVQRSVREVKLNAELH